jgi:hypothetical protein
MSQSLVTSAGATIGHPLVIKGSFFQWNFRVTIRWVNWTCLNTFWGHTRDLKFWQILGWTPYLCCCHHHPLHAFIIRCRPLSWLCGHQCSLASHRPPFDAPVASWLLFFTSPMDGGGLGPWLPLLFSVLVLARVTGAAELLPPWWLSLEKSKVSSTSTFLRRWIFC